ncbi:MAG TPA: hypothetical protein DD733_10165, partial [Clostridiales bacterium]|nr:hypothetical protein [Clostridiales bacterium]
MSKNRRIIKKLRFMRKNYPDTVRFSPSIESGLSREQVNRRIAEKKINTAFIPQTKSILTILKESTLSLFNLVNAILIAALIYVGSPLKNMLFSGVVLSNLLINLVQEL